MTTTVTVKVGGQYECRVVQTVINEDGHIELRGEPVVVGPQEEKYFTAPHGKKTMFEMEESEHVEKKDSEKASDQKAAKR